MYSVDYDDMVGKFSIPVFYAYIVENNMYLFEAAACGCDCDHYTLCKLDSYISIICTLSFINVITSAGNS